MLRDIILEVGLGQTLGIVGPPGAGKSTVANLIPRFYDVDAGRITIDGQDVRDVSLASLRRLRGPRSAGGFSFRHHFVTNNIAYAGSLGRGIPH